MRYLFIMTMIISLLVIISLFAFSETEDNRPNHVKMNIGNFLCMYFFEMALAFLDGKDFHYKPTSLKALPTMIPFDSEVKKNLEQHNFTIEELHNEEKKHTMAGMWYISNSRRHLFWKILKPKVNSVLNEMFRQMGLVTRHEHPVIHFRCSDVPFARHNKYMLQNFAYFRNVLEKTGVRDKDHEIIIVSCNDYRAGRKEQNICKNLIHHLQGYINGLGYRTLTKCGPNMEDFAFIFYSPLVISTGGSFAFMSGFFGNGEFYSEGHVSPDNKGETCGDCNEWMITGYSITHNQVPDYYNIDEVVRKLQGQL